MKTYEEQVWKFLVIEVAPSVPHRYGQRQGFDSETVAYENCRDRQVPAFLQKTLTGEVLYRNY